MLAVSVARIAIAPGLPPGWLAEAVTDGGGELVDMAQAEALVWTDPRDAAALKETLEAYPQIRWVQLPWAGVEPFAEADVFHDGRIWTCGKGVYAEPVAEHALAMALFGLRDLHVRAAATRWGRPSGRSLFDGRVTILGGGGIAECLLELLAPMRVEATVVRREPKPLTGRARVLGPDRLHEALGDADAVFLALALTPETEGIIDRPALEAMASHAWLVNVARGKHVVTDHLVDALQRGVIAGAALDVTDPEPLPEGHPLWALPNCLITPHVGNTPEMAIAPLRARVRENVQRWAAGEPLVGPVDPDRGY